MSKINAILVMSETDEASVFYDSTSSASFSIEDDHDCFNSWTAMQIHNCVLEGKLQPILNPKQESGI